MNATNKFMILDAVKLFVVGLLLAALMLGTAYAATTNYAGHVVQIDVNTGDTRPAQSIATPGQVSALSVESGEAAAAAAETRSIATAGMLSGSNALARTKLYSRHYQVTSTVFIRSVGGIPFDPSNQTIRVYNFAKTNNDVHVYGTVTQNPLVPPVLDWRYALNYGPWSNATATATEIAVPSGMTNAVKAYRFDWTAPEGLSQAFFRIVDNSSGVSGSGLYWLVYGAIYVDGKKGWTGVMTNVVGSVTNTWTFQGGVLVQPLEGL